MKRLLFLSAATLMLAGLWTEPAQSLDHPYWGPTDAVTDGPSADHPWGGDKSAGGPVTPQSGETRRVLTATTGFAPVDFVLSMLRYQSAIRMSSTRLSRYAQTSQPSVTTTGTTPTNTDSMSIEN